MQDEFLKNALYESTNKPDKPVPGNADVSREYSPLVLAYIGDAVYEVFVRTLLVSNGNMPVNKLHRRSIGFVEAKAQSNIIQRISPRLTPEERDIVRRGRNAKSYTVPKNADLREYRQATGFEALVGFLYLKGDIKRLMEVMKMAVTEEDIREREE